MTSHMRHTNVVVHLLLVLAAVCAMAVVGASQAHAADAPEDQTYDTVDECLEAVPMDYDVMSWSCMGSDETGWTANYNPPRAAGSGGSGFGAFLVLALLWSAIPFAIAASMARNRGESMGGAVLLTLILGWIGLAIVWFGQQKAVDTVQGLAAQGAQHRQQQAQGTPPSTADVKDRLQRLEELHDQGMITAHEYEAQRQRVLEGL